jgi:hypothetical protein
VTTDLELAEDGFLRCSHTAALCASHRDAIMSPSRTISRMMASALVVGASAAPTWRCQERALLCPLAT